MLVLQVVLLVVVLGFVLVAFLTNPTPERQFEERARGTTLRSRRGTTYGTVTSRPSSASRGRPRRRVRLIMLAFLPGRCCVLAAVLGRVHPASI